MAFAIDAWWDESQEREREKVLLSALLVDTRQMRGQLDGLFIYTDAIRESAMELLRAADDPSISAERVDALLGDMIWILTPNYLQSSATIVLVSGGEMSVISDPALVRQIAVLSMRLQDIGDFHRLDQDFWMDVVNPFLIANTNWPQIAAQIPHMPGMPSWPTNFPEISVINRVSHIELISNSEFRNILMSRIDMITSIQKMHSGFDVFLDETIVIIEEELAG